MVQNLTIPTQIKRILTWQWLTTCCITAVLLVFGRELALSAFLGGLVCVLPNLYFARQIFTKRRIAVAPTLLRTVYIAEFIKLGLTIALLAIVLINYKEAHPIALFATYFIVQSCMWAVPLFARQAQNNINNKPNKNILNQTH